ncbi:unnamed protein product, partial [Mesorhabditis belari]|uniref:Uncharacterized protein n=1 Tax=Mesorhabditis belari TaxID=2138241 RepID=A0AAF3JB43_9BILA
MSSDYRLIILILTIISGVLTNGRSLFADYEDDDENRPNVAWVPIVSRNLSSSSQIYRAFQEVTSREPNKTQRIAQMLHDSYDRNEDRSISSSVSISHFSFISLLTLWKIL